MPLEYRILSERNLVFVRFWGFVDMSQSMQNVEKFLSDPDRVAGLSHVLDLTDVTGFERDFTRIMSIQAKLAEGLGSDDSKAFFVFIAPDKLTRSLANSVLKSWREIDAMVPLVLSSLNEAAEILGLDSAELITARQRQNVS